MHSTFKKLYIQINLLVAITLLTVVPVHADHIKVFLLGGQSNMVGTGANASGLPIALQTPQTDVLFFYNTTLTSLRPGSGQSFGPEVTFGRTIADAYPSDNFAVIKYAVGGSDLVNAWDPTTGGIYANFRAKVADGLAALTSAGHTYEIVGMLWTQGERDARIGRNTAQYEADLIEFIADIRTRYGANLSFYLNRLSVGQTDIPNITLVRTAQQNVTTTDPHAYLIDADGMSFHDELHFDAAGQIALGEAFGQTYINARTPDTTNPTIDALAPANGSLSVQVSSDLTISFDEPIALGSGFITIRETSSGTAVESYNVATLPVNISINGSSLTINPTSDLANTTDYYVEVDATAIDDLSGNSFAGISGSSIWAFTTEVPDITNPVISSLDPVNDAINVPIDKALKITFSESVTLESGFITLRRTADNSLVESYNTGTLPANITLAGSTITITPTAELDFSTRYYIEIDSTAIDDLAGNSFAGFASSSIWNFKTADDPNEGLIDGADITATASESLNNGFFEPSKTIDDSGISGDQHAIAVRVGWLTNNPTTDGIANQWIQWDLGAPHTLGLIQVWNYNQGGYTGSGIKNVDIYVSAENNPGDPGGAGSSNWEKIADSVTLPAAPGLATYTGFSLEAVLGNILPSTPVRFVRFEVNSTYHPSPSSTYANGVGLSEIRFFKAPIPLSNTFANWISGYTGLDGLTALEDDPDGDGHSNAIENYFGTDPGKFSPGLVAISSTSDTFTFSHPLNSALATDLTAAYTWTSNLADYHADGDSAAATTVCFTQSAPISGIVTVTATVTGIPLDKLFVNVRVAQN